MVENETDDPLLIGLYEFWSALHDTQGGFPPRRSIDPLNIPPKILPSVFLIQVEPGPKFYYRLVGTNAASGIDPTGTCLTEVLPPGPFCDHIAELYSMALKERAPIYAISHYFDADRNFDRSVHRVFLPLSDDGRTIDVILAGHRAQNTRYFEQSLWERMPEIAEIVDQRILS